MPNERPGTHQIERHTIYQIPLDQRHGRARHLLTLWFGANMQMLTIVTGALGTSVFGQSFLSAALAIVVGNLVGAIFMALHAAQGPQLGVPQMVQSRGQFGSIGASFVVAIVVFMYVGYFASGIVIGGQSLHTISHGVSEQTGICIIGLLGWVATIYGHDLIHLYTRLMTYVSGAALVLSFVWIVFVDGLPPTFLSHGSFSASGFLGMVSVGALWQISYAPYVSDYSRYMPPGTGPREAFWASYVGCSIGSILPMWLGAIIGVIAVDGDIVSALASLTGSVSRIVVPLFALGLATGAAMNLYCGSLSAITLGQTFLPRWQAGSWARIVVATVLFVGAIFIALVGEANFLVNYTNFVGLMLYVLVPWTAVNLVDYYLVRYGDYHIPSFFAADGGVYGKFNWPAMASYALGILVQIPFIASNLYVGPAAKMIGGVDISWMVGLAVVSPVYYWAIRAFPGDAPALRSFATEPVPADAIK